MMPSAPTAVMRFSLVEYICRLSFYFYGPEPKSERKTALCQALIDCIDHRSGKHSEVFSIELFVPPHA